MIESGKIDIGIPIVPIDYTVMKVNKDGKLVMIENYDISISFKIKVAIPSRKVDTTFRGIIINFIIRLIVENDVDMLF